MSTEYQQVPSQQAFFSAQNPDLDPWLITATSNMTISWGGKGAKREYISPPVYEEDTMSWSAPATPTYKLTKKPIPSQFLSTLSNEDPWAVVHADQDDTQTEDSVEDDASQNLYKTELCRSYEETGTCRYGTKCQFAHGKAELRSVLRHPKYKTEICKTFHTQGTCPYGTRCRFIHTRPKGTGVTPTVTPTSSTPSSPTYHSPMVASPYTSPTIKPSPTKSRSSPATVENTPTNNWTTQWPTEKIKVKPLVLDEEEEGEGEGEGEEEDEDEDDDGEVPEIAPKAMPQSTSRAVPRAPQLIASAPASPSHTPKKRLAIFRTIC